MFEPGEGIHIALLGEALLLGLIMGVYYDIFRIIRRIIRCRYANIVGQDVFFWVTSAFMVFFVMIRLNSGQVRILFVAMVLVGWIFYMFTAGALVMYIVGWCIRGIKIISSGIHKTISSVCARNVGKARIDAKK